MGFISFNENYYRGKLELIETIENDNMGEAETLSDFPTWGQAQIYLRFCRRSLTQRFNSAMTTPSSVLQRNRLTKSAVLKLQVRWKTLSNTTPYM